MCSKCGVLISLISFSLPNSARVYNGNWVCKKCLELIKQKEKDNEN